MSGEVSEPTMDGLGEAETTVGAPTDEGEGRRVGDAVQDARSGRR